MHIRGIRLLRLFETVLDLCGRRQASPDALGIFNGHLQWHNLLNRPLYACLDEVYQFVHAQPATRPRPVGDKVLSELLLNVCLFPWWSADLRRPWWSELVATDASPAFGFGMCTASTSSSLVRATAAASATADSQIRLRLLPGDEREKPRVGSIFRLPLTMADFKPTFSIKARLTEHSGTMELEAVKLALLRTMRKRRTHSCRGVVLVDARAIGYGLDKGRSSGRSLVFGSKAVAAISLACNLKLTFPYIPSESNPADFSSRGTHYKRSVKRRPNKHSHDSLQLQERAYRRAYRRWRQSGISP